MTYRDRKQVKSSEGIKVRLSEHDEERLQKYLSATGGQAAAVCREFIVRCLDSSNVPYSDAAQNAAMRERQSQQEVADAIRAMRREVESRHLNDDRPDNAVNH